MKKLLLSICILLCLTHAGYSQCAVSSAPGANCNYGLNISAFSLAGIASTGNAGCSAGGYGNFLTPVRTLTLGQTYSWSITFGSSYLSVGIWIDLNNDGFYTASEMVASGSGSYNYTGTLTIPMNAVAGTNRSMRVRAADYYSFLPTDACNQVSYYQETEDYKLDLVIPPQCNNMPLTSVVTPTYLICPNGSTYLGLATTFTNYGYQYQWQYNNTSAVGPWTIIPGATQPTFATGSMTATTYYSVIMSCTNTTGSVTATAGQVTVAAVITGTVPYYEDFEGINIDNQLPNCSWWAPSTPTGAVTYTSTRSQDRTANSGSKYAAFYTYYVPGSNYFYSHGLQMYAGVTYSASLWYKTSFNTYQNITNLSLSYGTSQTPAGLTNIATATGPINTGLYKGLGGTFQVPSDGLYYVAIKATSNGNYGNYYLCWDDLRIEIPCSLNTTTIAITTSSTTICSGEPVNLSVTGADTFTWNTGSNASNLAESPIGSFLYSVVGTNTMTGCTDTQSQYITVNPSPNVVIFADKVISCSGSQVHLTAYGADAADGGTYLWSNNSPLGNITVSPTLTTTYQVVGTNSFNCQTTASQQVSVVTLPVMSAQTTASDMMCAGETHMLTGNGLGVVTFQWASNTLFIQSQNALISPMITTVYTLTGIDAFGCEGKTTINQTVDPCTGINKSAVSLNGVKIYPNPSAGLFTVELNSALNKTVDVSDITGRIVFSASTHEERVSVNISNLSSGIYYVKVKSENSTDVIKVVKQ